MLKFTLLLANLQPALTKEQQVNNSILIALLVITAIIAVIQRLRAQNYARNYRDYTEDEIQTAYNYSYLFGLTTLGLFVYLTISNFT